MTADYLLPTKHIYDSFYKLHNNSTKTLDDHFIHNAKMLFKELIDNEFRKVWTVYCEHPCGEFPLFAWKKYKVFGIHDVIELLHEVKTEHLENFLTQVFATHEIKLDRNNVSLSSHKQFSSIYESSYQIFLNSKTVSQSHALSEESFINLALKSFISSIFKEDNYTQNDIKKDPFFYFHKALQWTYIINQCPQYNKTFNEAWHSQDKADIEHYVSNIFHDHSSDALSEIIANLDKVRAMLDGLSIYLKNSNKDYITDCVLEKFFVTFDKLRLFLPDKMQELQQLYKEHQHKVLENELSEKDYIIKKHKI